MQKMGSSGSAAERICWEKLVQFEKNVRDIADSPNKKESLERRISKAALEVINELEDQLFHGKSVHQPGIKQLFERTQSKIHTIKDYSIKNHGKLPRSAKAHLEAAERSRQPSSHRGSDVPVMMHFKKREEDRSMRESVDALAASGASFERTATKIMDNPTSQKLYQKKAETLRDKHNHPKHDASKKGGLEHPKSKPVVEVGRELSAQHQLPQKHHEGIHLMEKHKREAQEHVAESLDFLNPSPAGSSSYGETIGGSLDSSLSLGQLIWTAYQHNKSKEKAKILKTEVDDLKGKNLALRERMAEECSKVRKSLADLSSVFEDKPSGEPETELEKTAIEKQKEEIAEFYAECEPILKLIAGGKLRQGDFEQIVEFAKHLTFMSEHSENEKIREIIGQMALSIGMMTDYQINLDLIKIKEALLVEKQDLAKLDEYLNQYMGHVSSLIGGIGVAVHGTKFGSANLALSAGGIASNAVGTLGLSFAAALTMFGSAKSLGRNLEKLYHYEEEIDQLQKQIDHLKDPENADQMSQAARAVLLRTLKARQDNIKKAYKIYAELAGLKDFMLYIGSSMNGVAATLNALGTVKCIGAVLAAGAISATGIAGIVLVSVGIGIGVGFGVHKGLEYYRFKPVKDQAEVVAHEHAKLGQIMMNAFDGYDHTYRGIDQASYLLQQRRIYGQKKKVEKAENVLKGLKQDYYNKKFKSRTSEHSEITKLIKKMEKEQDRESLIEVLQWLDPSFQPEDEVTVETLAQKATSLITRYVLEHTQAPTEKDLDVSIAKKKAQLQEGAEESEVAEESAVELVEEAEDEFVEEVEDEFIEEFEEEAEQF